MGKIQECDIHCPELQAAYERAMEKAINAAISPSGVSWPAEFGNHVSAKGRLEGSDSCAFCRKRVEVDLLLTRIEGAVEMETGKVAKVYDILDEKTAIKVSGSKCRVDEHQR